MAKGDEAGFVGGARRPDALCLIHHKGTKNSKGFSFVLFVPLW